MMINTIAESMKFAKEDACYIHIEFDASGEKGNCHCVCVGDEGAIMFALSKFFVEFSDKTHDGDDAELIDELRTGCLLHRMKKEGAFSENES